MSISEKYNLSALPKEWAVRFGEARDSNHPRVDEFKNIFIHLSGHTNYTFACEVYGRYAMSKYGHDSVLKDNPLYYAAISLDEFFDIIDKKEWMPKYGEKIVVSSDTDIDTSSITAIFLGYISCLHYPFICVHPCDEEAFANGSKINPISYKYAKPLPQTTTLTKAEIAEKLCIPVESLIITD